ncbi:MAG: response regulator, partial [Bacteroidota bacterium]
MIKCAVIDDEPLAREIVVDYIHKVDFLELVAEANNPIELSVLLERKSIDLIFLDIQTPVINGIDYLKSTSNLPMVIFTTAYSSYALESYQLDVMDYLLKPITFDRFFKAVSKTKEYFQLTRQLVTS